MKLFRTQLWGKARQSGRKSVADLMTQEALLNMKEGQILCVASLRGNKYFKCIPQPKNKMKIFFE